MKNKNWDAIIIKKDLFMELLRFNFGTDYKGNNYIIVLDDNELLRFHATSDTEAIKTYEDFRKK